MYFRETFFLLLCKKERKLGALLYGIIQFVSSIFIKLCFEYFFCFLAFFFIFSYFSGSKKSKLFLPFLSLALSHCFSVFFSLFLCLSLFLTIRKEFVSVVCQLLKRFAQMILAGAKCQWHCWKRFFDKRY